MLGSAAIIALGTLAVAVHAGPMRSVPTEACALTCPTSVSDAAAALR